MARTRDLLQLSLTDMAHGGEALARHDGKVVFVAYGIPGEDVLAEVEQQRQGYAVGRVIEVIAPSPHRRTPQCRHFGDCGGCQWQHIEYSHQLALKRHIVGEQLRRIAKLDDAPVAPTIGAAEPWRYRNHVRLSVGPDGELGFVRRASHLVVAVEDCPLAAPLVADIMRALAGKRLESRQVTIRVGVNSGQCLIQPRLEAADLPYDSGQSFYEEELLGRRFRISADSFFQVNTAQAARLVGVVAERLRLSGAELLVDAYAGVGVFGVLLAPQAGRVICIEESPAAAADAAINLEGVANIEYVTGKAEQVLPRLKTRPDAVILDPPRVGCHRRTLTALLQAAPPCIVYVSCDAATLARDLRLLVNGGYRLVDVQPMDMFPQTFHIESVATLVRA